MFEERAEEYANNTRIKDKNTYTSFPDESISEVQDFEGNHIDISERIIKTFKDGAEFGYNKANEWHYVRDGDLPSDRHGHVVINQDWDKVTIRNGMFEYLNGGKADVITWKEIVFPKEVENVYRNII